MRAFFTATLFATVHGWGYCNDNNLSCANWASAGECDKDHVKKMCPHSCSICIHNCRDSDESCPQWGDGGECESNYVFMTKSCPVTCGVCKTRCYDKDVQCPDWARAGECTKNSDLFTICPVSCGTCTDMCLDKQNDCPRWAADGHCGSNPAFMLKQCPHSCAVCDEASHAQSSHPVSSNAMTGDGRRMTERSACADTDRTQCLIWGEHECDANPAAVMKSCPHTCGLCTTACEDKYADCPNWAANKECSTNGAFMLKSCPHSCGICPKLHVFPSRDKDEI
jgi:hypothetical protein